MTRTPKPVYKHKYYTNGNNLIVLKARSIGWTGMAYYINKRLIEIQNGRK